MDCGKAVGAEDERDLRVVVQVVLEHVPDDPASGESSSAAAVAGELDAEICGDQRLRQSSTS